MNYIKPLFLLAVAFFILPYGFASAQTAGGSANWQPPVGIPMPPFGIRESHTMYTGKTYAAGGFAYRDAGNGPYTHYIDNSASSCSDADTYGTASAPRCTIPPSVPAGSVVEIHGGPYASYNKSTYLSNSLVMSGTGTAAAPIFYRGAGPSSRAVIGNSTVSWSTSVLGHYIIVEYLDYSGSNINLRNDAYKAPMSHIALRHLTMHGDGKDHGTGTAINLTTTQTPGTYDNTDIVVWDNVIHSYGDYRLGEENDYTGITNGRYDLQRSWIVDNDVYHVGGDSIRVGSNPRGTHDTRYVYIGRNHFHDNNENALDVKLMNDVVVSENIMHGFRPSASDPGACVVVHSNPGSVWFLKNHIYDCSRGITSTGVIDLYAIGNNIHDINEGIRFYGGGNISVVNNTVTKAIAGIEQSGSATLKVVAGNSLSDVKNLSTSFHLNIEPSSVSAVEFHHNLFYQAASPFRVKWGGPTYTTIAALQSGSGKCEGCVSADPSTVNPAVSLSSLSSGNLSALFQTRYGVSIDSLGTGSGTAAVPAPIAPAPAPIPVTTPKVTPTATATVTPKATPQITPKATPTQTPAQTQTQATTSIPAESKPSLWHRFLDFIISVVIRLKGV